MALTDPLGDMLTRIRNGQRAKKDSVLTPGSKLRARVLDVLQRAGRYPPPPDGGLAGEAANSGGASCQATTSTYPAKPVNDTVWQRARAAWRAAGDKVGLVLAACHSVSGRSRP